MKLIRFGDPGGEKPGVLLNDGTRIDVSGFGSDYNEDFFSVGGLGLLRDWLVRDSVSAPRVPTSVRLGPPICAVVDLKKITGSFGMNPPTFIGPLVRNPAVQERYNLNLFLGVPRHFLQGVALRPLPCSYNVIQSVSALSLRWHGFYSTVGE
jgi:hypothetical protein